MPRLDHFPVTGIDSLYSLNLGELAEESGRDCPEPNRAIRTKMLATAFEHYGSAWMGGLTSWSEATAVLEKGWPEGAERLRVLGAKLSAQVPQAKSIRRKLTWADDGRATFEYGEPVIVGEPHILGRRVGTHTILHRP